MQAPEDPFKSAREKDGLLRCKYQGESIPMVLRHHDIRRITKDHATFSSDAPFRVPIPSEENVRTVRQLPIETDPPDHTDHRRIIEPVFRRPRESEMQARIPAIIATLLDAALSQDSIETVADFALPLQSRALACLLAVPEAEAEEWIGWGIHVFRVGAGEKKGAALDRYLRRRLDRAAADPGDDFFSLLTRATFQGRPLTRDEQIGFGNLVFAGGRDTVIHSVTGILAHFAEQPASLDALRGDEKAIATAGEEFLRVLSPLTHLGRVCPQGAEVLGETVPPDGRIGLCWSSANRDADVFEAPDEVRLDRRPNPHIAFGSGPHACIGAAHARLLIRDLIRQLGERVARLRLLAAEPLLESRPEYTRRIGYESLRLVFEPLR